MTDQTTDFFDGIGGGSGAPSAELKNTGDQVHGTIVDMFKRDYIPFGAKEPEKRVDGTNKEQLVIVLETEHRNWQNVSKVPKVDPADPNSAEKPPSEDDGKRAVYVPEGKNIQFAIGRACTEAQAKPTVGGQLWVKVFNLKPTDKGNPLKEHVAKYQAPSAGQQFFEKAPAGPAQESAPKQESTPAASTPAQQDPWASTGSTSDAPPF